MVVRSPTPRPNLDNGILLTINAALWQNLHHDGILGLYGSEAAFFPLIWARYPSHMGPVYDDVTQK